MQLEQLSQRIKELLSKISPEQRDYSNLDLDWNPAVLRSGAYFQSDVCERLADRFRWSPAVIAKKVQAEHSNLDIDNRGFLFAEMNGEQPKLAVPNHLQIYIQPPAENSLSLYHLKFISMIGLQIEFIRQAKLDGLIYIASQIYDCRNFFGKQGFLNLLNLLKDAVHSPELKDLYELQMSKDTHTVLWLNTEILSLPKIASVISNLREAQNNLVTVKTVALKNQSGPLEKQFLESYDKYGFGLLLYIAELNHPLDLDWEVPSLKNWQSMRWLASSLGDRIRLGYNDFDQQIISPRPGWDRAKFLVANLEYLHKRAGFQGDCNEFLTAMRELFESIHRLINRRQISLLSELHIPASFPEKISSIIEGF